MTTPEVCKLIKTERLARNWTQGDLAGEAQVSRVTVNSIEQGKIEPVAKTLLALLEALDIKLVATRARV